MQLYKNYKTYLSALFIMLFFVSSVQSTEECFEKQVEQSLNLIWLWTMRF